MECENPCSAAHRKNSLRLLLLSVLFIASVHQRAKPEVVCTYIPCSTDQGIFAKQLQQLGVQPTWVGSPTLGVHSDHRGWRGDKTDGRHFFVPLLLS